jgi:hypothetical protein
MVGLIDGCIVAIAVKIAVMVSFEYMHARRRMIVRRRRRHRPRFYFMYMLRKEDYALDFEAGLGGKAYMMGGRSRLQTQHLY